MLIDVIEQSIAAMDNKREAQAGQQSAQRLGHALGQLEVVSRDMVKLLDCAEAIASSGIDAPPVLSHQTRCELVELVNECGRDTSENALRIETVRLLEKQVKAAKTELANAWQTAALAYSNSARGYLAALGGLTDNPTAAKDLQDNIDRAVSGPPTKGLVGALVRDVKQAQEITGRFSLRPDIEDFLRKVGRRQATVEDLTDDILGWLKEKNLMHKIGIRFLC